MEDHMEIRKSYSLEKTDFDSKVTRMFMKVTRLTELFNVQCFDP